MNNGNGFRETPSKMRTCVMPSCRGILCDLVHKFPMNNERAKRWLQIINVPELSLESLTSIRKKRFICSRHFRLEDYKNIESRSLNLNAEPSQMLDRDRDDGSDEEPLSAGESSTAKDMSIDVVEDNIHAGNVMRLEINFDTVQVVNASNVHVVEELSGNEHINDSADATTTSAYLENTDLEDDLLNEDIVSILEPSPDKANTYRLSTISKKHRRSPVQRNHPQPTMTYDDPSEPQHIHYDIDVDGGGIIHKSDEVATAAAVYVEDNGNDGETSEMLLIPLSTESYKTLQNRLLQQQSQSQSHPEIAAGEIVLDDILMEVTTQDVKRENLDFGNSLVFLLSRCFEHCVE